MQPCCESFWSTYARSKMEYYFKRMNYSGIESLQSLCWVNYLEDWIQEEVGIQVEGRGFLITKGNSALLFRSALSGWRGLEFIGKSRAFWSDEVTRNLWVLSYFVVCCRVCFGIFESCRTLSEKESALSSVVESALESCSYVSRRTLSEKESALSSLLWNLCTLLEKESALSSLLWNLWVLSYFVGEGICFVVFCFCQLSSLLWNLWVLSYFIGEGICFWWVLVLWVLVLWVLVVDWFFLHTKYNMLV